MRIGPSRASTCLACARINSIKQGVNPYFILELAHTFVVAEDFQRYPGYCLLLMKSHIEHLVELPAAEQQGVFAEVAMVSQAVWQEFQPRRLNYECLGNSLPHVHWHVVPRYEWDPDPANTIWSRPAGERMKTFPGIDLVEIVLRLKRRLLKLG